ncbi:MAG: hypothetical protein ACON4Q_02145 [Candidatus Puniceispirillaceae bacterium]
MMEHEMGYICRCPDCLIPVRMPIAVHATPHWPVKCHHCQSLFYPATAQNTASDRIFACLTCGLEHNIPAYLIAIVRHQDWPLACFNCGSRLLIHDKEAEPDDPMEIDGLHRADRAAEDESPETRQPETRQPEKLQLIDAISAVLLGFCMAGLGVLFLKTSQSGSDLQLWISAHSDNILDQNWFLIIRMPFDWLKGL